VTRIALGSLEPGRRRRITARVPRALLAPAPADPNFTAILSDVARNAGLTVDPEVLDLMARSQWSGNLNVYFDRRPEHAVEVHRAFDLRITAGRW
jgi:hypothetical protein